MICFVGGSVSNDLQFVAVPLITNENCIQPNSKYPSYKITSNMVCAGFPKGIVYINQDSKLLPPVVYIDLVSTQAGQEGITAFPHSNAGRKTVLCSIWFIIFCLPKILHTYHIPLGVVNFLKICTKSSKSPAVLFLAARGTFLSNLFCPSDEQ